MNNKMSNHIIISKYDNYKFFSIETTANCNLGCKYCYYIKEDSTPKYDSDILVSNIAKFRNICICFLGGEPFLNTDFMEKIMMHPKLKRREAIFSTNTNGTCFRNLRPELLAKFSFHHVSIDGYRKNNDYFRGKGVFDQVINNLSYLRKYSDASIVARMTISNPDQINDIPKIAKHFDAVYWQLNNTRSELSDDFLDKYIKNLRKLFSYWKNDIFTNKNFTIIPFIGMCDLIITGGLSKPNLICGAGTIYMSISVDGDTYPCPESFHRFSNTQKLGDIKNLKFKTYPRKNRCKSCSILRYCGGRCAMTDDDLYCEGVKEIYTLTNTFIKSLDKTELKILKDRINYQKCLAYTTEVIP